MTPLPMLLTLLLALSAHAAFGAEPVRQKFVPVKTGDASSARGASFSRLVPGPPEHGGLLLHAHAGIGDKFPVRESDGETLFEVLVAAGDDDHLVLEVRSKGANQRCDVKRDMPMEVTVSGVKYLLSFPSVTVDPRANPTTDQAMIMVIRR